MDNNNLLDQLDGKLSESSEATGGTPAVAPVVTPVTPVSNSSYVALTSNAIDIIGENLKGQALSPALFDVVKSPTGGGTAFAVPGLSGEDMEKELIGIIIDYRTPRAYWDTPDPVEGTPPKCFSRDSITSSEGKSCHSCMFNEFGSKDNGDGAGKACKESIEILLLRPDSIMPVIVRVPVTSKVTFQKYMMRLAGRMITLSSVVTKITLEKTTNGTGQPYSLYNFEAVNQLSPEEATNAKAFGAKFMEVMNSADVDSIVEAV